MPDTPAPTGRPEQTGQPAADAGLSAQAGPSASEMRLYSATGKGLRHGFGVAMVTAGRPLPIHVLSQLMGHASTKVTEIYLQMVGEEQRQLVMEAWES